MIRMIKKICLLWALMMSVVTPVFAVFETQSNTSSPVAGACIESQLNTSVGPATIEAKWTPNAHTVSYACGTGASGTAPATQNINFDATFTLANTTGANCTKNGYGFSSWLCKYLDGANNTPSSTLTNNTTYNKDVNAQCTAQWVGNLITLNWDKGGHPNAYSDIPTEYQPVEYIQSSGTQYIETDWKPNFAKNIHITGKATFIGGSGYRSVIFGNYYPSENSFNLEFGVGGNFRTYAYKTGTTAIDNKIGSISANSNAVFDFDYTASSGVFTSRMATSTKSAQGSGTINIQGLQLSRNMRLFLDYRSPATVIQHPLKIYGITVQEDGQLIHNYVPVKRKSDNEIGLYDTVSGNFLTNAGTGSFTAGNPIDVVAPDSCIYGTTFTMPVALLDTGYTFNKWNVNNKTFNAEQTNVECNYANLGVYSGSATITASWTAHTINLIWNKLAGDTTPHAENTCTYDGDITLPSQPSRTGFSFAGWKLEE